MEVGKPHFSKRGMGLVILFDQENLGQKRRGFWGLMRKPYKTPEFSSRHAVLISPLVTDKMTLASNADKTPTSGSYPETI